MIYLSRKRQRGIQAQVLEAVRDGKRLGFDCITTEEIIRHIQQKGFKLRKPNPQVSQALYQLQRYTKYKRQRIKKASTKEKRGWSVVDVEEL